LSETGAVMVAPVCAREERGNEYRIQKSEYSAALGRLVCS
jgi:hypothetical protein